jgi:DNA (cytosine-5)-methyltransferase 1
MAMRLLDLFSGIGGFSYAAEKLIGGYETVAFCEMDEFCQKILKKHWPQVPIYDDVRTIDAARLGRIDIVTGGYPCQPFSQAGRRQGEEDERHLWPEMLRIIKSCQPRYVVAENVAGHVTMGLDQVLTDLEDQGYTTRAIIVPACAKNAPHRRDRVWIIGQNVDDSNDSTDRAKRGKTREKNSLQKEYRQTGFSWFSDRTSDDSEPMANTDKERIYATKTSRNNGKNIKESNDKYIGGCRSVCRGAILQRNRKSEQRVGNMADGISRGILRHFDREPEHIPRVTKGEKDRAKKLKALGNSIVPQVAAEILLAIRVSEESD